MKLRILEILQSKDKTKYWLYKQMGMSYQNFSKMVNNETKSIKFDNLDKTREHLAQTQGQNISTSLTSENRSFLGKTDQTGTENWDSFNDSNHKQTNKCWSVRKWLPELYWRRISPVLCAANSSGILFFCNAVTVCVSPVCRSSATSKDPTNVQFARGSLHWTLH